VNTEQQQQQEQEQLQEEAVGHDVQLLEPGAAAYEHDHDHEAMMDAAAAMMESDEEEEDEEDEFQVDEHHDDELQPVEDGDVELVEPSPYKPCFHVGQPVLARGLCAQCHAAWLAVNPDESQWPAVVPPSLVVSDARARAKRRRSSTGSALLRQQQQHDSSGGGAFTQQQHGSTSSSSSSGDAAKHESAAVAAEVGVASAAVTGPVSGSVLPSKPVPPASSDVPVTPCGIAPSLCALHARSGMIRVVAAYPCMHYMSVAGQGEVPSRTRKPHQSIAGRFTRGKTESGDEDPPVTVGMTVGAVPIDTSITQVCLNLQQHCCCHYSYASSRHSISTWCP
jgi:hypothetical protein